MKTKEFTLTSGAKLAITESTLDECDALMSALAKCSRGIAIQNDLMTTDVNSLKDYLAEALSSGQVKAALWVCLGRAKYQNARVNKELFDSDDNGSQAREDYFEIMWKVIEVNCAPFFAKIFSLLKTRPPSADASPKPD